MENAFVATWDARVSRYMLLGRPNTVARTK